MITISLAPGATYPVVLVPERPSADALDGPLRGAPMRPHENGAIFSIWDADTLAGIYGEPQDDFGVAAMAWLRKLYGDVAAARAGTHPAAEHAPAFLLPHQKQAWAMMMTCAIGAIYHEPGLGKTVTASTAMAAKRGQGGTLVVCPLPLVDDTWMREFENRWPDLHVVDLNADIRMADTHADGWVINTEKLRYRPASLAHRLRRAGLRRIIVDEASTLKNFAGFFARVLQVAFGATPERYLLTGTPAPNSHLEYWAQIDFLAPGLLGTSIRDFKAAWFVRDSGKLVVPPERLPGLMERIGRVAIYAPEEIIGLPPPVFTPRYCDLPEHLHDAYDMLKTEAAAAVAGAKGRDQKMLALAYIMRRRQLANGYVVDGDGKWHLVGTHKFELLERTLAEIGEQQVVIWCNFIEDFAHIPRLLPHRHARARYIWGATRGKGYRSACMEDFRSGRAQYIFANPATLQFGVTLFEPGKPWACNIAVDLNLDYSLEKFDQSHFRIRRIGMTKQNFFIPLMVRGTIEEGIYARVREKRVNADEALEMLK